MKTVITFTCFILFSLISCPWEDDTTPAACADGLQEGAIIGQDFRRCACCGGWFIELGQDTVRTLVLPETFGIDPMEELPIEVCLSFEDLTGPCADFGKLISLDEIKRR